MSRTKLWSILLDPASKHARLLADGRKNDIHVLEAATRCAPFGIAISPRLAHVCQHLANRPVRCSFTPNYETGRIVPMGRDERDSRSPASSCFASSGVASAWPWGASARAGRA